MVGSISKERFLLNFRPMINWFMYNNLLEKLSFNAGASSDLRPVFIPKSL